MVRQAVRGILGHALVAGGGGAGQVQAQALRLCHRSLLLRPRRMRRGSDGGSGRPRRLLDPRLRQAPLASPGGVGRVSCRLSSLRLGGLRLGGRHGGDLHLRRRRPLLAVAPAARLALVALSLEPRLAHLLLLRLWSRRRRRRGRRQRAPAAAAAPAPSCRSGSRRCGARTARAAAAAPGPSRFGGRDGRRWSQSRHRRCWRASRSAGSGCRRTLGRRSCTCACAECRSGRPAAPPAPGRTLAGSAQSGCA
mmetsp:Transcript_8579/g.25428  ORF Transcript_8579/g.25428 Transcript_8579/m.25428 type:complete len:251 (-) Transcript_8579:394-1146(-)